MTQQTKTDIAKNGDQGVHKPVHPNPRYNPDLPMARPCPVCDRISGQVYDKSVHHASRCHRDDCPRGEPTPPPERDEQPTLFEHRLDAIAKEDVRVLVEKGKTYGDSWNRRGGAGAFMVTARKWDRLEKMCEQNGWDIYKTAQAHPGTGDEGFLDQVRDLRRYLLLWEQNL